jgi:hypothetical protein
VARGGAKQAFRYYSTPRQISPAFFREGNSGWQGEFAQIRTQSLKNGGPRIGPVSV